MPGSESRRRRSRRGGKGRLALVTWIGVYPVLTLIALAVEPILSTLPIAIQTFIMSAIMVPVMVFAVMPALRRWIRPA